MKRFGVRLLSILATLAMLFALTGIAENVAETPGDAADMVVGDTIEFSADDIGGDDAPALEIETVPEDIAGLDITDEIVLDDIQGLLELPTDMALATPDASEGTTQDGDEDAEDPNAAFPKSLNLGKGETYALKADKVKFISTNSRIAKVDQTGLITAVHTGTATISAMSGTTVVGSCSVTVLSGPNSVSLSKNKLSLEVGATHTLAAKLPKNTASNKLTWKSSNTGIAKVSAKGLVTAVSEGKATITVTTFNNISATCAVSVKPGETATDITFDTKSITIGLKETVKVNPTIIGGDVNKLIWKSSNESVATVDKSGKITGKKVGKAKITVRTPKELSATMVVHVMKAPAYVKLPKEANIKKGKHVKLKPTLPDNTASYKCKWKSSNKKVATVNANGVVKGLKAGTATITVTTFNNRQATCTVTVSASGGSGPEPRLKVRDDVSEFDLSDLRAFGERKGMGGQDIAIYNGTIFSFSPGSMYVNGQKFSIVNGHGNNCMFGKTLHGDYPYLYCGSWNRDSCEIYVNQLSSEGATLVNTISYPTLKGYLNCCVDEAKQRIYILLNTSPTTKQGDVDFIVSDFNGNILSKRSFGKLPVIQGMVFYRNRIYVLSGYGTERYPSYLSVLDTSGKLVAISKENCVEGEYEGIDFDDGALVLATPRTYYRQESGA